MTSYKVLCKLLTTRFKMTKLNGSLIALACLASYCLGDGSLANPSAKILAVLLVLSDQVINDFTTEHRHRPLLNL